MYGSPQIGGLNRGWLRAVAFAVESKSRMGVRAALRTACAGLVLAICAASPALASPRKPERPFKVRTASLTQGGRLLYWRVRLNSRFSVTTFKQERRSLCLLIEGPAHGHLSGRVCFITSAHPGAGPRLVYQKITHGHAGAGRILDATVRKPKATEFVATFTPTAIGRHYTSLRWQILNSVAPPACDPTGHVCHTLYPARAAMLRLHTPRLVGCTPSGSSLIYHGPSRRHELALTFDDGPWNTPPTSQFLDVLERDHVAATFFEIGEQISPYDPGGKLERRMLADGDMIGDHTWSHPDMTKLSSSEQRSQLVSTADAIRQATHGFQPCMWRPPYGSVNSELVSLARSLGMLTIQWDVDTVDWSNPGTATIYQRAVSGAHNGAIILQHFGGGPRYETLDAVPQEIRTLRRRGYHFVNLAQLLGLRLIYK